MPFVRTFTWNTDKEYGFTGWIPAGMPHFDAAGEGLTMAHDVLEHFDPKDDSIEAEFLAFGSMLYLRAESDYWCNIGAYHVDPAVQMSGDIFRFCQNAAYNGGVRRPLKTRKLDEDMEAIMDRIDIEVDKELRYCDPDDRESIARNLAYAYDWMRRGYRKAAKRWNMQPWERVTLFHGLECTLDGYVKDGNYNDTLKVSVDIGKQRFTVEHIKYVDPYNDY